MNLKDHLSHLYDRLGYQQTPDSAVTRRLRAFLNEAQHEVFGLKGFSLLRRQPMTFASVANSPFATLPQAVVSIQNIADRLNRRNLDVLNLLDVRWRDPGLAQIVSVPNAYAILDLSAAVALDPTAASALYVVSDSAADGTGISAFVEGLVTGGYSTRITSALNGVTPVQLGTLATWEHITKFYVSGPATGHISLHQTSGIGPELARIQPARTYARYTRIHLSPTPSAALTYTADVERHLEEMLSPTDESLLPEDFHFVLEAGALMREYARRRSTDQWQIESTKWNKGVGNLRVFVNRYAGLAGKRRGSATGFSQLGPWFSANS